MNSEMIYNSMNEIEKLDWLQIGWPDKELITDKD